MEKKVSKAAVLTQKEQQKALSLLSIGTLLEYFDLYLYIHMAVLLHTLFFPPTNLHTQQLLIALTYCTTYVFRPLGALLFGYLGDTKGRRATIVLTTFMMALSCLIMAILPTYAQIGLTASWIAILCRIIQGCSSLGEIVGAEIYVTETMQPPSQYLAVAILHAFVGFGALAALSIAKLTTAYGFNWRLAFLIGAGVAVLGAVFRRGLHETPAFVMASNQAKQQPTKHACKQAKISPKTSIAYFLIQCASPVFFYFVYIHCSNLLQTAFGYTAQQVITHNLRVAMVDTLLPFAIACLSIKIYPLKILKGKLMISTMFGLTLPWLLNNLQTPQQLLLIQACAILCWLTTHPASSIFYQYFTTFKRFTYTSCLFAIARAIMQVMTSFGMVYLLQCLGNWGLWVLFLPVITGYAVGLFHFDRLASNSKKIPTNTAPGPRVSA